MMHIALTSIPVVDPVKAHHFYAKILGFKSKEFVPDAQLAIVVSPDDLDGTALILEPRGDSFYKDFQVKVCAEGLPVIIFGVKDLPKEVEALKGKDVRFRDDLSKQEWGLDNIFEDTCGNYIMLQETSEVKRDDESDQ